jgi:putative ABC transport system permease protein
MFGGSQFLRLAVQSLQRNRIQTGLAMLGVVVGVGALVTSMALGRGAQEAIKDQLLAAGANMIVVTAGNYQLQRSQGSETPADHASIQRPGQTGVYAASLRQAPVLHLDSAVWYPDGTPLSERLQKIHFEDDPMAVHDHPTAKDRLGDSMAGLGAAATLTLEDAEAIRKEIPGVQFVATGVHENARISLADNESKQWLTRLHGTEAELPEIRRGWIFPEGKFLTKAQADAGEQVMVLGRVVADRLFGEGVNPVGKKVLLWKQPFEIVGVVGSRSWAAQPVAGDDQFDAVYVPVKAIHRLLNLSKLNTITVTTASAGDTTRIAKEIVALLRDRHGIAEQMADDFTVKTQAQELLGKGLPPELARIVGGNLAGVDKLTIEQLSSSLQRANWTMLALLAGVATVSLVVGGIGVMNLLLLSVTQRTREVGLRMALGARRSDIALQFVVEAVLLSLLGGLIGAVAGVFISASLESVLNWSTVVSPLSTVLAIVVAAVLGIVSGVYPAQRAAQLDPIEALHHE